MQGEKILRMVREWFAEVKLVGLELPSGYFGRPYDNQHELTFSIARPHKLILELDSRVYLIFTDVSQAHVEPDALVLAGFRQLVFDRQDYGDDKQCHVDVFVQGAIRFVAHQGAHLRSTYGN